MNKETPKIRVLFNGSCPVCSREIAHYRGYCETRAVSARFEDLTGDAGEDWGLSPDEAARRLHVLHEGRLLSGMEAFRALWSEMPRYRWLARLTGLPVVRQILNVVYEALLAPLLYRSHRRRFARAESVENRP